MKKIFGEKLKKIKTKLRKGDSVVVISGKFKGKVSKILEIDAVGDRAILDGLNKVKKTVKKSQENQKGAIIEKESYIHLSNVMFYDGKNASKLGYRFEGEKKVRYSKKDGKILS